MSAPICSIRETAEQVGVSPTYLADFFNFRCSERGSTLRLVHGCDVSRRATGEMDSQVFPGAHSRDKAEKQRLSNLKTCVRKLVSEHEWTTDQIAMAVAEAINDVSNLPADRYEQEWQS
ncbi:MAG: hypothetical protein GY826_12745 [Fuerstiella sp.]|nr:hypothetical protein [Fuerstiella sp.]